MATSSILGADRAPFRAQGRDVDSLGPSDISDSGSDIQGAFQLDDDGQFDTNAGATQPGRDSDSDSFGTGERGAARIDEEAREGADILPDEIRTIGGMSAAQDVDEIAREAGDSFASDEALDENEEEDEDDL